MLIDLYGASFLLLLLLLVQAVQIAATMIGQLFMNMGFDATHTDGLGSSYRVFLYHVKIECDFVQRKKYVCV